MEFKQYIGKRMVAWLSYNQYYFDNFGVVNKVCYVYPRFFLDSNNAPIDSNDFPNFGGIEVRIQGNDSAEEIFNKFGSLVSIKINDNHSYPNLSANNIYNLKYNSQLGSDISEIWIETFSGKGFYQIIDVENNIVSLQNDSYIPEPNYKIFTTLVLLRSNNKLYGPFEYDTKEGKMILRGMKDYQYLIGEYGALDYNGKLLDIVNQNNEKVASFIPRSVIVSPKEAKKQIDWISEETLIDSFIESLGVENNFSRDQVRQFKELASQLIEGDSKVHFTEERISRIQSLFKNVYQKEENVQKMIQYALSDESTKENLVNVIINNHFDQIKNRITEFTSVQERLSELKAEEESLKQSISELHSEPKTSNQKAIQDNQNKIVDLNNTIVQLQKEKDDLVSKIGVKQDIDNLIAERDKYKQERDRAKENYNQQLLDNNELERQFSSTLESFNNQAKQTARILDSKILEKILRGVGEEEIRENISYFDSSLLHSVPISCNEIIDRVANFIRNKAHRDVSNNDVANYLICISQGFITTFAGEPGTGKTSLCNILAKALGLVKDTPQNRFIDISVERGWSSQKDFIGYYNPLTKSMEKSNIELFNAFVQMDTEYGVEKAKIAPFIILLDEANLSPLEHYWAAFLRICDFSSSYNRSIVLGGNKSFRIPEHLRFLATVNFDHTTEELSPRFLDRSWVIMLDPTRIDDDFDDNIENYEDMVSFGSLQEAFCVGNDDVIDEAIQNKWNTIQKIFRDKALQIMPRNLKMVKNYCAVGCRCMEHDTPTTKFAPLDYAFSQKILPTINGSGENYQLLIEELLKECTAQNMPISAKHLERIKRIAENNMGFFQFFTH